MRILLATICCRFRGWGLVKKLNFCSDFEHKVWSRFWSWSSGKTWSWSLVSILLLILVSYIFRIKDETFCTSKNYTFWVVTGLVSSYAAYKMNTHGMEHRGKDILWQCLKLKLEYSISFNLNLTSSNYFRSWTYFMLPCVTEEYKTYFMAIMMMMMIWVAFYKSATI